MTNENSLNLPIPIISSQTSYLQHYKCLYKFADFFSYCHVTFFFSSDYLYTETAYTYNHPRIFYLLAQQTKRMGYYSIFTVLIFQKRFCGQQNIKRKWKSYKPNYVSCQHRLHMFSFPRWWQYLLSQEARWGYSSEQRYLVDQLWTVAAAAWLSPALPLLESSAINNAIINTKGTSYWIYRYVTKQGKRPPPPPPDQFSRDQNVNKKLTDLPLPPLSPSPGESRVAGDSLEPCPPRGVKEDDRRAPHFGVLPLTEPPLAAAQTGRSVTT
jgi:hypothetical protein